MSLHSESRLETAFSMVSCISTSTFFGVGWYVDSGASRHMITNKSTFSRLEEQDSNMQVELGDDAKYSVIGMGSISFCMLAEKVIELHEVLYVHGLSKNLLSIQI
jgi:hypothetical protein